ncbi:ribonuclease III [Nisaea sp.]|jgi:ribonuclease III|uniref:ribonuclease III n=1 Tax=Nisaea sp. TaxID=2024842 RepID=UPI002B26FB55|nr:ribonuclease III [Nisaea sp.]
MEADLSELEEILGHTFGHTDVLRRAVTHASAEPRAWNAYERLEFLGDRVLALIMAEHLLDRFPHEREGAIAKRHVGLVRREALSEIARQIGLGRFLIVSRGETEAGVRESETILSDAMEAVIGALYLDGGLEAARRFILQGWNPLVEAELRPPQDAKTTLQEWVQARKIPLPTYDTVNRDGPAHAPEFTIRVSVQGHGETTGTGKSKRIAEQDAAGKMIAKLNG